MISKGQKILVIGSANIDLIMQIKEFPSPGETVIDGRFAQKFGGKGANQAVAAARAGATVTFIGVVGTDAFGDQTITHLQNEKINIDYVQRSVEPTGIAFIQVDQHGENVITVSSGANFDKGALSKAPMQELIVQSDLILLQNELPISSIEQIIKTCGQLNRRVFYNPAPFKKMDLDILKHVEVLIVNETEMMQLMDIDSIDTDQLATYHSQLSCQHVILTRGAKGAIHLHDNHVSNVDPFPIDRAIDTTGAGDTFCGYLTAALSHSYDIEQSIKIANQAAALSTLSIGAQEAIPHWKQLVLT